MHVTANSKEVRKGSIFVALKGAKFDGHDFIESAFKAGANTVYAERDVGNKDVIVLGNQARKKLGELASEAADHPSHTLKMIGITGTSGKTTTTYLIHHLLNENGIRCARMGTNGAYFEGKEAETINTTPDAVTLHQWFREVKNQGAEAVVMEVSSHALDQDRVWGITWDAVCFLNLSREHMDYHPTIEHYFDTKALLFKDHAVYSKKFGKNPRLFSQVDHAYGKQLKDQVPEVNRLSIQDQIRNLTNTSTGLSFEVLLEEKWFQAHCPLFGSFQIENILTALNAAVAVGIPPEKAINALSSFSGVPGRMEQIKNDKGLFVFVDYAHKPEALEKVLQAIQFTDAEKKSGKYLITVFGCGGDRDKTKRPVMGEIATRLSDAVIITSDNPRTEDPATIINEIVTGISHRNFAVIQDRRAAIEGAIKMAKPGDVILIAGKGHEDYQIIGTEKIHFDDREEARRALN